METPEHIVVLITANGKEEARRLAGLLLEKRLAACVNIVPAVESSFWWQGKLDTAAESLLVVKSRGARLPEIIETVRGAHSNAVPEIIALPIVGGDQAYLDWINGETA